ncbi:MAG: nickel-dependent lactate racemase [Candidatus Lokiarchaeota archaeon]|nr:nickel-dependent lactate racemase [Candidatus Lokiarchaeota archaeon]
MLYNFPYKNVQDIRLSDDLDVTIYHVKELSDVDESAEEIVKSCLNNPFGAKRISESLNPDDKVLLIVDDISRPTPIAEFISVILDEIHSCGVKRENVEFLIALGTHRFMTPREMEQKLGNNICNQYIVKNHEWNNPDELHNYGTLNDGTEVVLNKAIAESDFVIGVGSIAPHPAAGFSGGGKIIVPGVGTDKAAGNFHWESIMYPQKDVLGVRDNPMRENIDKIANMSGFDYIVNVIMDGKNRVVKAVCGDPIEAHKIGCEISLEIFGVKIKDPDKADIFIIDTHPLDQELWQGVKALCALECIIPDNAIGIIVSPLPEGICQSHPEVLENGFMSFDEVKPLVDSGQISKIVGHNLVQGGRLLQHTTCYLVSPGVSKRQANQMGFDYYKDPQTALESAIREKKDKERIRVIILGMGGEIAPIVD